MSKQKFNVGDKVKILDTGEKAGWVDEMQSTVGKYGIVQEYDEYCEDYLVCTDSAEWWYRNDDLELVSSAVTNNTIDVQTCIDFLTSNGYKVTLEKL